MGSTEYAGERSPVRDNLWVGVFVVYVLAP
jgi:hypothetical protein